MVPFFFPMSRHQYVHQVSKKPDKSGPRYNEQPPVDSVRRRIHKSIENKSFFAFRLYCGLCRVNQHIPLLNLQF